MKKFRLGVVGCGHRGRDIFLSVGTHIKAIEAVAACDIKPELWFKDVERHNGTSKAMATQMPNVTFYENYDEMLEKAGLDIVLVDTPAMYHASFCAKALAKNIHVFSDIPSVGNLADADMLWKAKKKSTAMFMTGATTCGYGFIVALQDMARQGLLGKPFALEADYIHDCRVLWEETPWRKPTTEWGWPPITYCTHSLGPLLSIIDEELRSVYAVTTGSHLTEYPYAHDYMSAFFQTPSNVTVRITTSFINALRASGHYYRVFGTEGTFEHFFPHGKNIPERTLFNSNKLFGANDITELPITSSPFTPPVMEKYGSSATFGHGGADAYLWLRFMEALENGAEEAPISLQQGLAMTLPGIYAAESAFRGGVKLDIHYPWDGDCFQKDIETFHSTWARSE